jgi:CrcB protein
MLFWIAAGGALGTLLRYLLGGPITSLTGGRFPLGTLLINVAGAFAIGLFARAFLNTHAHQTLRAALMVGVCGGFTTFSAFSLETITLIDNGLPLRAVAYVLLSVTLSLLAAVAGLAAGKFVSFA